MSKFTIFILFPLLINAQRPSWIFRGSPSMNWEATNPESPLQIAFEGNVTFTRGGTLVTAAQASKPPVLSWNADPEKYYLVAMIDPDAPTKAFPVFSDVVHWMVGNVKGGKISAGDEIASYVPPNPGPGSGPHRFSIVIYEQPYLSGLRGRLNYYEKFQPSVRTRTRYNFEEFVYRYKLGKPVAQNYFIARWQFQNPFSGGQL